MKKISGILYLVTLLLFFSTTITPNLKSESRISPESLNALNFFISRNVGQFYFEERAGHICIRVKNVEHEDCISIILLRKIYEQYKNHPDFQDIFNSKTKAE